MFSPNAGVGGTLRRVSSSGGTPEPVTRLAPGEVTHRWPQLLPGGKAVLFTAQSSLGNFDDASLVAQALPTGARTIVQRGGYYGRYLPSGHLVYVHNGTLFAAPFDLDRLQPTGAPVPVIEGVTTNVATGGAQFASSSTGTLAYLPGPTVANDLVISWADREGTTSLLRATPANWSELSFAPDGRRLAIIMLEGAQSDIWVDDWQRDTVSRLTIDRQATRPVWTPDGQRIVFASKRGDAATFNLYWQRADGTGEVQRLTESKNSQLPGSWHPSGKLLAFAELDAQSGWNLMILPMEGDEGSGWTPRKASIFLGPPFGGAEPRFSPDGRWLAYQSSESGRNEVYVRPFPGPGGKSQISTDGGTYPIWSPAGSELFFATFNQQIMVASYTIKGDAFQAERPRLWSALRFTQRPGLSVRSFDLHPDGKRVALAPRRDQGVDVKHNHVTLIFNFFDELRRLAPSAKR